MVQFLFTCIRETENSEINIDNRDAKRHKNTKTSNAIQEIVAIFYDSDLAYSTINAKL